MLCQLIHIKTCKHIKFHLQYFTLFLKVTYYFTSSCMDMIQIFPFYKIREFRKSQLINFSVAYKAFFFFRNEIHVQIESNFIILMERIM